MRCPRCGGQEHRLLSPNYAECTSEREIATERPIPDARYPGGFAVVREVRREVCGHRFHVAGASTSAAPPVCRCGMFAIGRCADCGEPVCGEATCSARRDGLLLCVTHAEARAAAAAARDYADRAPEREAAAAEAARQVDAHRAALAAYEERRARLTAQLDGLDEAARVVAAVAATCTGGAAPECHDAAYLAGRFPDVWPDPELVRASFRRPTPPWDSRALARWFAARATAANVPFAEYGPGGLWWRPRLGTPRRGWVFPSTEQLTFAAYMDKRPVRRPAFVEHDGRLWRQDDGSGGRTRTERGNQLAEGGHLHVSALLRMASMLGLSPAERLDGPPAPSAPIAAALRAEAPGEAVSRDELDRLLALASRLRPRRAPTPGRVDQLHRAADRGALTADQVATLSMGGAIPDELWRPLSALLAD